MELDIDIDLGPQLAATTTAIVDGGSQAKGVTPNPATVKLFHYSDVIDNIDEYSKKSKALSKRSRQSNSMGSKQLIQMICCITGRTPLLIPVISMLFPRNNPKTKPIFWVYPYILE